MEPQVAGPLIRVNFEFSIDANPGGEHLASGSLLFMIPFRDQAWAAITPTYQAILDHPFLKGLVDGGLPSEAFRFYVIQDGIYLKHYARTLALLGAKSDDDDAMMMFCNHAANAIQVERALHTGFLADWGISPEAVDQTPAAPNCLLYTSYLTQVVYSRPAFEGLAAVLPCYWIYREVGRELIQQGSVDKLFQRWIDTYGGEEFGEIVEAVLQHADRVAAPLTEEQRGAMIDHFQMTSRMEFGFWDMGYRQQAWWA